MAIGSGMLTGKGYKNNQISSVKNADFIAEQQTDFIFAVIGEEFGFVGTCAVIILLVLISIECFLTARRAKDRGCYLSSSKYRSAASVCELWSDLAGELFYWNWICFKCGVTMQVKMMYNMK